MIFYKHFGAPRLRDEEVQRRLPFAITQQLLRALTKTCKAAKAAKALGSRCSPKTP